MSTKLGNKHGQVDKTNEATCLTHLRAKWLKCSCCGGRMGQHCKVLSHENKFVRVFSLHIVRFSGRFLVALSWTVHFQSCPCPVEWVFLSTAGKQSEIPLNTEIVQVELFSRRHDHCWLIPLAMVKPELGQDLHYRLLALVSALRKALNSIVSF